jgi:hypothetical protein
MPLGSFESASVLLLLTELDLDGWSPTIVEVDEERLKVFASGARWVSLSSGRRQQTHDRGQGRLTLGEFPRHGGRLRWVQWWEGMAMRAASVVAGAVTGRCAEG